MSSGHFSSYLLGPDLVIRFCELDNLFWLFFIFSSRALLTLSISFGHFSSYLPGPEYDNATEATAFDEIELNNKMRLGMLELSGKCLQIQ